MGDGSNKVCCRREEHKEDSCIERKTGKRERDMRGEKNREERAKCYCFWEK